MEEQLADLGVHQRAVTFRFLVVGEFIELPGDVAVEECCKSWVGPDQVERDGPGDHVAKRFVAGEKLMLALAVNQRAAVESVLGAEQCEQGGLAALLDCALDHDIERVGRGVAADDRLTRTEVYDIERRPQRLALVRRQTIERRVADVECLGHCGLPGMRTAWTT